MCHPFSFTTLNLLEVGDLYSWGLASHYQTGHGSMQLRHTPHKLEHIRRVQAAAAGLYHSLALTSRVKPWFIDMLSNLTSYRRRIAEENEIYSWGVGTEGQLGIAGSR